MDKLYMYTCIELSEFLLKEKMVLMVNKKGLTKGVKTDLHYVYILERQVLDRGGGP